MACSSPGRPRCFTPTKRSCNWRAKTSPRRSRRARGSFYLQFGLREDSARHTNEALGFHKTIIAQPDATMAAAWVCAALELIYAYDDLLALDWSERVMLRLIMDEATQAGLAERKPFDKLVADWNKARPIIAHAQRAMRTMSHRQSVFSRFAQERLKALPGKARSAVQKSLRAASEELAAFQEQMALLAALETGPLRRA